MNQQITTSPSTGWERPEPSGQFLEKHSADDIAIWQKLTESVSAIAISNGFSKSEVQRRIGMQNSTFSQWFSGTYIGRLETYNRMAEQWISAFIEASGTISTIRQSPLFIQTRLSREIFDTLVWAQTTADMVMVTVGAGNGQNHGLPHLRGDASACLSRHRQPTHEDGAWHLVELASELDVREHNPAKLTRAIGAKLGRIGGGSLLIVDEAQNLIDDAINQLRHFMDIYHCGIALVGNDEVYTRFGRTNAGHRMPSSSGASASV